MPSHVQTETSPDPFKIIPWWDTLDPAVRAELALSSIEMLSIATVDVVVIGSGVAGLNAALSARRHGADVLLLEAEPVIGRGATGRNAGILSAGVNMHLTDLPLDGPEATFWPETNRVLLALVTEAAQPGALLEASLTGSLSLAESISAARKLAREARARVGLGLRAEMWTPAQVSERTRGRLNTQSVKAALWMPDEGRLNPLTLLAQRAQQARTAGVTLAGQARVTEMHVDRNRWRIQLANGSSISARGLIQAVGPTTQPNARIYALAFAADLPVDFPLFWDAAPYTYADYRPGDGRLTVSGGRYGKAGVTRRDASYYQRLANGARHWLPELQDQEPRYTWAVDLAVTADMIPTLRPLDAAAPGYAIEGLGALGVLPGAVLAEHAGELIVQKLRS
jgi:glycine/D-amino acid oxidase-like deaminating enzyme